ncbi:hypothetical protein [Planosporangium mesophilum]|uniref:Uncharacterized protein n=1 Tax=Planosporangium mesophilum TaxID=689768 RepID=A0A8J3X7A8_9ACTN|nr:hypothetical protein [Planosporangium mesophilum]NJC86803.1 hypothetical protein [Planosporangium mesophilum]GII26493.1 hypothetical protein Pme01_60900 [Planosporangium mesophilum]
MTDKARTVRVTVAVSPDLGAYATGALRADQIRCALCTHAPCDCPPFGTPAYFDLIARRHGHRH